MRAAHAFRGRGRALWAAAAGLAGAVGAAGFFSSRERRSAAVSAAAGDGAVYTWGSGQYGQLGLGDEKNESLPQLVTALSGRNAVQVVAGGVNSGVLTSDGHVWTFGSGQDNRTGHGDGSNVASPRRVEELEGREVVRLAASPYHMAAITKLGRVFTWGRCWSGQLGHSGDGEKPQEVESMAGKGVIDLSLGGSHTLAVTKSGELYAWGDGHACALGLGHKRDQDDPVRVEGPLKDQRVTAAAAGSNYSLVLSSDGSLYSMGSNEFGQTAHGSTQELYTRVPTRVQALDGERIVSVAAGDLHAAAVTDDGKLYTWGYGKDGQLGHGDTNIHSAVPRHVRALADTKIASVSCGGGHTAAVDENGNLHVWGRGRDGQLGRGDRVESIASAHATPHRIESLKNVYQAAVGSDHTIALVAKKE